MSNTQHFGFIYECSSATDIITALSHQLESLKVYFNYFSYNESCTILNKMTDLKTITLILIGYNYDKDDDEHITRAQHFTKTFVNKVINNQSLLQYLRFKIDFVLLKVAMSQLESEIYSMIGNKSRKSDVLVTEFDIYGKWKRYEKVQWLYLLWTNQNQC